MQGIFPRFTLDNLPSALTLLTILAACIALICYGMWRRKNGAPLQLLGAALGLGSLVVALATSYGLLCRPPATAAASLWALVTGPALFFLAVLLKLLLIYVAVVVASGLFKPSRITEFSAKLFGMELNYKYATEIVEKAERSQERVRRQMDVIGELNQAVFAYLASPFEGLLARTEDKAETVRQIIHDVLLDAYDEYADSVRVYVLPLVQDTEWSGLSERLATQVRLADDEDEDTLTLRHGAGIAVFHGEHGFGSIIVLEGCGGYTVSMAEICAAGTLYYAVAEAAGAHRS